MFMPVFEPRFVLSLSHFEQYIEKEKRRALFYLRGVITCFFPFLAFKRFYFHWMFWCVPLLTALGRRQVGKSLEFEASSVKIVRPCLKKKEKKKGLF